MGVASSAGLSARVHSFRRSQVSFFAPRVRDAVGATGRVEAVIVRAGDTVLRVRQGHRVIKASEDKVRTCRQVFVYALRSFRFEATRRGFLIARVSDQHGARVRV